MSLRKSETEEYLSNFRRQQELLYPGVSSLQTLPGKL